MGPKRALTALPPFFTHHFVQSVSKQFSLRLYVYLKYRGRGRMVVGFTTTCAISAYHH